MNKKVVFTLTILAISYWFLFDFLRWVQYDSPSFIGGSRLMFGLEGGFNFHSRLTKPIALLLPGLMELLTGLHPKYTFLFQNVICFFLCGIFIYKINQIIFKDDKKAFLGMLAYSTCQVFAIFSLFILTDVIGWFFGIFGIYLTLKYFSNPSVKPIHTILFGTLIGLGCLAKESAVIGLIFLISYLLLSKFSFRKRSTLIVSALVGFVVPIALSHLLIDHFYNDSLLKLVRHVHDEAGKEDLIFSNLKQLFRVLDMHWFLFTAGLISVIKTFKIKAADHMINSVLLAMVTSFLMGLIWPSFQDRILFMIAPFLIIFTTKGIEYFKELGLLIILLGGILNVLLSYFIYKYDIQGGIVITATGYLTVLVIAIIYQFKKGEGEEYAQL
ncbi:MAG: glycosyltransferase family 39 protein [Flavobacteriales bacterium]|nr:glycosyltransferase family 39 protein [Flavobacteriales bacterium]